jgi:hypothetical protein
VDAVSKDEIVQSKVKVNADLEAGEGLDEDDAGARKNSEEMEG